MEGSGLAGQSLQKTVKFAESTRLPAPPGPPSGGYPDSESGLYPFRIPTLQIIQQLAPVTHQGKESPAGVVILFVRFEVLGEL